ncbi:tetraacyldisaccharide 4'-kinase [Candidatus Vecturithrix granuli]|uniref:Tetraacyldisaccharide 4'-kinase n=1 Tax=Vecturithrix granuli TaxID=1499967 RepID=A0A0S6WB92_VECG1|nr:tetraacyldisaccharide 4'-kinase [Candidatus Vecturithrix granuli]
MVNIIKIGIQLLQAGKPTIPDRKSPKSLLHYAGRSLVFMLLQASSLLYSIIIWFRLFLYQKGIFSRFSLPCAVISVGNITTGGTGKTPTVIEIARILQQHGKRAAILTRGYRRKTAIPNYVVDFDADVRQVGDEPLLMLRKLSDVPVIVGSQRYISGKLALERFQPDVLLLDDGFQHIQLRRDLDLVLIDATNPFGGEYLLPAGFLREPLDHLRRAQAFVITRSNEVHDITPIVRRLQQIAPDAQIFTGIHTLDVIRPIASDSPVDSASLRRKRLLAVSGLGNPQSFRELLSGHGLNVVNYLDFADHHWYTEEDIVRIRQIIIREQIDAIMTTEKDEIKLLAYFQESGACYIAAIRLDIQPEKKFEHFLLNTIRKKHNGLSVLR